MKTPRRPLPKRTTLLLALPLALLACGAGDRSISPLGEDETDESPATGVLSTAVQVGDPLRARFPSDTLEHTVARSIWDLQSYAGRVYVGSGDYWRNSGPTEVWSFDGAERFALEHVVDDEMVDKLRVYDGKLLVPGIDARESWDFGNFYLKDGGGWQKHRTIPGALHVFDIALHQGKLYAYCADQRGSFQLQSADGGESWSALGKRVYGSMVSIDDRLLILNERGNVYQLAGGKLHKYRAPLPGSWKWSRPRRLARFKGGALYTAVNLGALDPRSVLYHLAAPKAGVAVIDSFLQESGSSVRDILVRGEIAYVLTAREHPTKPGTFVGYIFSSPDLLAWEKLAEFEVPAPPYSFERLNGAYYVGLGNHGDLYEDASPEAAAGSIWRLQ